MTNTQKNAIELMALKDITKTCNLYGLDFFRLSQAEKEAILAVFTLGIEFLPKRGRGL